MDLSTLDNPIVLSTLFYPRPDQPGSSRVPNTTDGTIPVTDADADPIVLGYRLYAHDDVRAPLLLYFHGNGEIASDHDMFAQRYRRAGMSLLVVDYRGYGWSTGSPTVTALLADVAPVLDALPGIVQQAGLSPSGWLIMGRSLGSAPAIHAAHMQPDRFQGIIIESGFSRATRLLARLGLPRTITDNLPDPVGNDRKLAEVRLPLLVIHGENDTLLPVMNGQELFDVSRADDKRILRVRGAGHNDLLAVATDRYFDAIAAFVQRATADGEASPAP